MTLKQIVELADKNYPDGAIISEFSGHDAGDGLARFIVRELRDTYDKSASDAEQIKEAWRVLDRGTAEIGAGADAFAAEL